MLDSTFARLRAAGVLDGSGGGSSAGLLSLPGPVGIQTAAVIIPGSCLRRLPKSRLVSISVVPQDPGSSQLPEKPAFIRTPMTVVVATFLLCHEGSRGHDEWRRAAT